MTAFPNFGPKLDFKGPSLSAKKSLIRQAFLHLHPTLHTKCKAGCIYFFNQV